MRLVSDDRKGLLAYMRETDHTEEDIRQADTRPSAPFASVHTAIENRDGGPAADTGIITLNDVAVRFGAHQVWQHATFSIAAGEFIALLGPNGAGKSTLLQVVLGLIRPSAGSVRVLRRIPPQANREIGYVPQRRLLDPDLPLRGRDLVMLGLDGLSWGLPLPGRVRRLQRERVQETLEAVEATSYADRPIGQLSGGEQQRLYIAQALVGRPRLMLLDEPLASLDLNSQIGIVRLVAQLASERGITVLLVTHDVNPLLPVVDRVLYVARGQVAIGTVDEIITTEKLSSLYGAPVEVVHDRLGRLFVVGLEEVEGHG
jgi:zinc/manganese transport system ATP-binding protein